MEPQAGPGQTLGFGSPLRLIAGDPGVREKVRTSGYPLGRQVPSEDSWVLPGAGLGAASHRRAAGTLGGGADGGRGGGEQPRSPSVGPSPVGPVTSCRRPCCGQMSRLSEGTAARPAAARAQALTPTSHPPGPAGSHKEPDGQAGGGGERRAGLAVEMGRLRPGGRTAARGPGSPGGPYPRPRRKEERGHSLP